MIKPQNQEDVIPGSELEKMINEPEEQSAPETNGTGSNKAVPTSGSVIIEIKDGVSSADEEQHDDKA